MSKKNTTKWENPTPKKFAAVTSVYVRAQKTIKSEAKRVIQVNEVVEGFKEGKWIKLKDGYTMTEFFKEV